jgi:two-component system response regulator (stage 0 sporulation protein A)
MNKISLVILESAETEKEKLTDYFKTCNEFDLLDASCDGKEGLDKIAALKPDTVILDIVLSGIDGYAVMERLVSLNKRPVIVVYSAFSTDSFVNKAVRMGADYFIKKPCDVTMLKDRVIEIYTYNQTVREKAKREISMLSYLPENMSRGRFRLSKSLDERITNIFISVGIPPHIKGYCYLREAVKLAVDEPEIINSITKRLYPSIAGRFDTSASKVERAIRHAIEVAWNRGKMENVNSLFGIKIYSNNDKPTNGEFIALIADKMLLEGA